MHISIPGKYNYSKLLAAGCLSILMIAAGCNNQNSQTADSQQKDAKQVPPHKKGERQCYNLMERGDTIVISINWLDSSKFTGSMRYQLHEKDRNIGTLEGVLKDSILLADYQFSAEGMTSRREVAFKPIADYLVEGYGDITPDSSGFKFADPSSLKYDLNLKIHKVNCL
ncbi:hypothetical protein GCM10027566_11620 [Arachidicoccus ginsenosidivorans]|jgi:hypothetical protein|uniref:Uncharacterized protein n=1 Tax=Arachidicoccus ginsenosidivorans TaxID=496057 RepID=A0A5B8VH61_9BACT|nr:hypothetical protein [Arachidicoccus ginsenosidivorans]QEC70503.1 hypothetical protein FSB73_01050 [Arachidicoccus ginsenosidivorans]